MLRDAYIMKFNNNGIRRRKCIALCHGLTDAKISAALMSEVFQKNTIRPGSLKRQIDFVELRDLKARLANDYELLQTTIADGPAFADQDTGDDMLSLIHI